jgi:hypothetical protein
VDVQTVKILIIKKIENMASCSQCTGTLKNTGIPSGAKPFSFAKGKAFMPLVAKDGTRNSIDPLSATLEADILAAVNNNDPSKRMYFFTNIVNSAVVEADANFATTDLNERDRTSDGITNVTWTMKGVTEQFFAKVQRQCVDFGEYEIDECGNFKGQLEGNLLYPRPVYKGSYQAKFMPATAVETSMVTFNYDYEYTTSDANQWYIDASEFGVNNPLSLKSLIDVVLAITVVNATDLTIIASFDYGTANARKPWVGAIGADITGANLTTPASFALTSLMPTTTDGTYDAVIPAQVATESCTLKAFHAATGVLLNGYESAATAFIAQ